MTPTTATTGPSSAATEKTPGASRFRVLLAEDNIVNQRLISRILQKMGHTVVVAKRWHCGALYVVASRNSIS
jgi:CheY-like chemotaxis protein